MKKGITKEIKNKFDRLDKQLKELGTLDISIRGEKILIDIQDTINSIENDLL